MKKISLFIFALVLGSMVGVYAQNSAQLCAASFKRNNGQGCQGLGGGTITFQFGNICPAVTPQIIEVRSNGVILENLTVIANGGCDGNGDITYCFSYNIPTATTLCFVFRNPMTMVIFDCCFTGGTLPISISSFAAARSGNNVNIKWQTASESNAKEFILQKKTGNSSFVDFATVAATNRSNGSSYSYVDNNTAKGITEYRLKLVDQDNSFKTSEIRS
ncbi:MAG: hypothetical protein ABIO05_01360, partial [Ferruginibacter sp.]